eukprot:TRINITY_DN62590_c0_g1_i1.p1 TRINITY_DN62590_c0_g1~~TRINITY_DN62590_c0_g1_i1.p1  ORF type:complete len:616 (+),score=17.05 TRINITY_DN62590_c0_g1_i1:108-1955(+)
MRHTRPSQFTTRFTIFILAWIKALYEVPRRAMYPYLPIFAQATPLQEHTISLLISFNMIVSMLAPQLVFPWLHRHCHTRPTALLVPCSVLQLVSLIFLSFAAKSTAWFVVGTILLGIATGLMNAVAQVVIACTTSTTTRKPTGILQAFVETSWGITSLLGLPLFGSVLVPYGIAATYSVFIAITATTVIQSSMVWYLLLPHIDTMVEMTEDTKAAMGLLDSSDESDGGEVSQEIHRDIHAPVEFEMCLMNGGRETPPMSTGSASPPQSPTASSRYGPLGGGAMLLAQESQHQQPHHTHKSLLNPKYLLRVVQDKIVRYTNPAPFCTLLGTVASAVSSSLLCITFGLWLTEQLNVPPMKLVQWTIAFGVADFCGEILTMLLRPKLRVSTVSIIQLTEVLNVLLCLVTLIVIATVGPHMQEELEFQQPSVDSTNSTLSLSSLASNASMGMGSSPNSTTLPSSHHIITNSSHFLQPNFGNTQQQQQGIFSGGVVLVVFVYFLAEVKIISLFGFSHELTQCHEIGCATLDYDCWWVAGLTSAITTYIGPWVYSSRGDGNMVLVIVGVFCWSVVSCCASFRFLRKGNLTVYNSRLREVYGVSDTPILTPRTPPRNQLSPI